MSRGYLLASRAWSPTADNVPALSLASYLMDDTLSPHCPYLHIVSVTLDIDLSKMLSVLKELSDMLSRETSRSDIAVLSSFKINLKSTPSRVNCRYCCLSPIIMELEALVPYTPGVRSRDQPAGDCRLPAKSFYIPPCLLWILLSAGVYLHLPCLILRFAGSAYLSFPFCITSGRTPQAQDGVGYCLVATDVAWIGKLSDC